MQFSKSEVAMLAVRKIFFLRYKLKKFPQEVTERKNTESNTAILTALSFFNCTLKGKTVSSGIRYLLSQPTPVR